MTGDPERHRYPDMIVRRILGDNAEAGTVWMLVWAALAIAVVGGAFSAAFATKEHDMASMVTRDDVAGCIRSAVRPPAWKRDYVNQNADTLALRWYVTPNTRSPIGWNQEKS